MRLLAAVCALSLIAQPAFGQGLVLPVTPDPAPAAPPNAIQSLQDCVLGQARRMEISGEAADIVAIAAIANCNRDLTAASTPAGGGRPNAEVRQQMRDAMREAAITQVVEIRTTKHTPPPPPPPPEPKPVAAKPPVRRAAPRPVAPKPAVAAPTPRPTVVAPRPAPARPSTAVPQ
jgi:hypothetical protein